MHTSVGLFALAAVLMDSAPPTGGPWLRDYGKGQELARREGKPLAVVVGTGAEGFEKLAQEGTLGDEVQKLLADHYVRVYLDRSDKAHAKLIEGLSLGKGGLVIGDVKAEVMAFHHEGTLTRNDLKGYLRTWANPSREVRTTQSHSTTRTSFYPGTSPGTTYGAYPGYYSPPASFAPSFAPSFRGGANC